MGSAETIRSLREKTEMTRQVLSVIEKYSSALAMNPSCSAKKKTMSL